MHEKASSISSLINELKERNKELNCLFTVEDTLNRSDISLDEAFEYVIKAIPLGWQYPEHCSVKLAYGKKTHSSDNFTETPWSLSAYIVVQEKVVGNIAVYYSKMMPESDFGPFLKDEKKLLNTIADRMGHFILHQKLKNIFNEVQAAKQSSEGEAKGEWRVVLEMLRKTDPNLFMRILRKLLHQLCWIGVEEAEVLLKNSIITQKDADEFFAGDEDYDEDENRPLKKKHINNYDQYIDAILNLTNEYLIDKDILAKIQKWIQEDKSSGLIKAVENLDTSLSDIGDSIRRYYHMAPEKIELSPATIKGLRVSLLRRFFTDKLDYISIAKEFVKLTDFYKLLDKMIFPPHSHGKLGGKSAGLFLALHILRRFAEDSDILKDIKAPKTWYLTSDGILYFMQHNNLEEALEQKYKEIEEVRIEYPHVVQIFKNSQFPSDIIKGLSVALDDLGDQPLIVRSSSLLEDQIGAAFSGKYKSLFLANRGSKQERLTALMDAIAEVYASTFSPDPIEYRSERGLIDFHEEMGIMIQEVVGNKIGNYFLPAYAGVAFSKNEFRWSARIKREDGLVRLVPGLGTRAVDRVSDDYPVLISPGQPNLRVNASFEEQIKYSPKKIDVINLDTNKFETITIDYLLKNFGDEYPGIHNLVSIVDGNMVRQPVGSNLDFERDDLIVTFNGLINKTGFIKKIDTILTILEEKLETPIDIEFASDGKDFYLLQCRPQSYSGGNVSSPIPKNIPKDKLIFSANRFVSNGKVPDINFIVYVDPTAYTEISDKQKLLQVGRGVSKLNKVLPKRKFILIGPGRWGSRGDIKLGVNVTYSDINNTAMLIEVAKKKGNYLPDLSFGTHFFQDLVEASIRYLPLYPDDEDTVFNQRFFNLTKNKLSELVPEFSHLSDVIKVIDVPDSTEGLVLKILMNAELDEALAVLNKPSSEKHSGKLKIEYSDWHPSDQWRWRVSMAEKLASKLDADKFFIKGLYIFGSAKNSTAGPTSDIDLLLHYEPGKTNLDLLKTWFEGWSYALSEMNFLRTGYKTEGLLDVHYVTDEDINNKKDHAAKIGAIADAARPLQLKKKN